ncbi:MAG: D-alanine--D-alanine ligase [Spirochaetes bacterium]|nr:D-alanine--D-alanine ligase [Spirochaetota bacterium]
MTLCVLYGGKSGEHEVSLRSAASIVKNLDPSTYSVMRVGIDKSGRWHLQQSPPAPDVLSIDQSTRTLSIVPGGGLAVDGRSLEVDCVFPVLHGTYGEDGTVQGLLDIAGIPYVGAGVLGSSVSLDKETTKRLWRDRGLPIVEFAVVRAQDSERERRGAASGLGYPLFVKPCAAGSSLGASRVADEPLLAPALADALRFDTRALLERFVDAREIECSVIGNSRPRAFLPGEVIPAGSHAFYDYEAKYTDPHGAALEAPARISAALQERIMRLAEAAYEAVRCEGMARVDFFLERGTDAVFVNEINTIPGFTSISMFPRMCQASGLPFGKLLDTLVELALERDRERKRLRYEL